MARDLSVNDIKTGRRRPLYSMPREGTRLRVLYNAFISSLPGDVVVITKDDSIKSRIGRLRDVWGLDLRPVPGTRHGWVLHRHISHRHP